MSAPVPAGLRERLIRNTVYGIGGRILGLAVTFVLTPFVVSRLGTEVYGIYALASVLTGYLALLDLGLGTGYVKYVAEAAARDDEAGVNEVLATGFWSYLGFGLLLFLGWLPIATRVPGWLGIAEPLRPLAARAFTVAVGVLALSGAAAAFRAVLYGLQRIDLATRVGVWLTLPRLLLTLAVLHAGHGLLGLVTADLALFLAGTAVMAAASLRVWPRLTLSPRRASVACLRRLVGYGAQLQVSRLAEMANFQLDKLLLSRFVGLRSVTDYDLGARTLSTGR